MEIFGHYNLPGVPTWPKKKQLKKIKPFGHSKANKKCQILLIFPLPGKMTHKCISNILTCTGPWKVAEWSEAHLVSGEEKGRRVQSPWPRECSLQCWCLKIKCTFNMIFGNDTAFSFSSPIFWYRLSNGQWAIFSLENTHLTCHPCHPCNMWVTFGDLQWINALQFFSLPSLLLDHNTGSSRKSVKSKSVSTGVNFHKKWFLWSVLGWKIAAIYPIEPQGPSQSPCGTHISKCLPNDFRLWKALH